MAVLNFQMVLAIYRIQIDKLKPPNLLRTWRLYSGHFVFYFLYRVTVHRRACMVALLLL